nr:MAG TPA: hypothetical protein [Caudoviricetes sp.]
MLWLHDCDLANAEQANSKLLSRYTPPKMNLPKMAYLL